MRRSLCLFMCLVLMMTGFSASFANAEYIESAPLVKASTRNGMVRVYLSSMGNPTKIDITVAGSYTADGKTDMALTRGETLSVSFDMSTGYMTMNRGGKTYDMGREMVLRRHAANGANGLRIAQTRMPDNLYPGDLRLVAQKSGNTWRMYAIVHVYIESYLYGVVPYEMGNSAHLEALKAQAVAARTYTLNKMNIRSGSLYDVVDTTADQVYYGNSDTTENCSAAVDATRGIVVMNGTELTGTYYTASNGGQMESAANGFGSSGLSYLTVKDDPFDLTNSASVVRRATVYADYNHADQHASLKALLSSRAKSAFGADAEIVRINAVTPHTPMYASPSRLYTLMDFDVTVRRSSGSTNGVLTLDIFSDLEKLLGMSINTRENELWSVENRGDRFVLSARRFGHGVGMSQRGAMQMGAQGYTYDQILGFYYNDCRRVQYTFTHTVLSPLEDGGSDTIVSTEPPAEITQPDGHTATVRLSALEDHLAIRAAASDKAAVLTSVMNGSIVTVLAKKTNWTLIRLGRIVGYVPTAALRFSGNPPTSSNETPTVISKWATVSCKGTLNLRSAASMTAKVLAAIPDGAVLCVFSTKEGWAQVQYGAQVGWASADFLRMSSVYPGHAGGSNQSEAVVRIPSGSGTVNLRETASTASRVLGTIPHGTYVTVLANDGSWCFVQFGGVEGYVMNRYLSFDPQDNEPEPETPEEEPELDEGEQEAVVRTPSGSLNLRAEPSAAAAVLMTLPRGESVIVTRRGDEWCAVRYAGISGYVMTRYLSFPDDGALAPVAYGIVATQSSPLNMRSQPSAGGAVVTTLPRGTRVGILSYSGDWTRVTFRNKTGYVLSAYLRKEGEAAPEQPVAYARVNTSSGSLNLRETPSADARVLAGIPQGTVIEVLQRRDGWVKTRYSGLSGYVMERYLAFGDTSEPEEDEPLFAWVNTSEGGLNLRETADYSAAVLAGIPRHAKVEVLIRADVWCKVKYQGYTGYVRTEYLTFREPADSSIRYVSTPGGGLNLRETPAADAKVLLIIPQGAQVRLIQQNGDWCKISYNDTTGYVMARYLTED